MRFLIALPCTVALTLGISIPTAAQDAWPSKPIRIIVGAQPAGSIDAAARIIAPELSKYLGQRVIVENRVGAGGTIGAAAGIKSPPDGYSVFLAATGPLAISPTLMPNLSYDPLRDMAPVSKVAMMPLVLAVPDSSSIRSVQDLMKTARAKPGSLSYATAGNGTANHLAGELIKQMTGIAITHVPYKGSAPAASDTLAGQVSMGILDLTSAVPHVRSGKLRSLGTLGGRRTALAPDLATLAENGLQGFDITAWFIMGAPAAVPRDIITRLNAETVRALANPEVRERILASGSEPISSSPEELGAFLRDEIAKWARVIKTSGVTAE